MAEPPQVIERRPPPTRTPRECAQLAELTKALGKKELAKRKAQLRQHINEDRRFTRCSLIVLERLVQCTNFQAHGYAYPSVKWLAKVGRMVERSVRYAISQLELEGLIVVELQRDKYGHQATSRYYFPTIATGVLPSGDKEADTGLPECIIQGANDTLPECKNEPYQGAIGLHPIREVVPVESVVASSPPTPRKRGARGGTHVLDLVLEEVARRTGLPDIVAEFVAPVVRRRPLVGAPDPVEVLVDVVRLAAEHSAEDRNAAREKILVERHINVRWLDFNSALTGAAAPTYKTPAERRADEDREFLRTLGLTATEGTAAPSAEREMISRNREPKMISRSQEPERFNFIMIEARKRGLPVAQTWERHGYMVLDAGQLTALEGLTSSNSPERCVLPSTPAD